MLDFWISKARCLIMLRESSIKHTIAEKWERIGHAEIDRLGDLMAGKI